MISKTTFSVCVLALGVFFASPVFSQGLKNTGGSQSLFKLPSNLKSDDYMAGHIILQVKNNYRGICTDHSINHSKFLQAISGIEIGRAHV